MRVLIISKMAPWPPDSGGRVRLWNMLSRLAHSVDLTVVAFGGCAEAEEAAARAGFALVQVPPPARPRGIRGVMRRVAASLTGAPLEVRHWVSPGMTEAVDRIAASVQPDVIQAEFYQMLPYVTALDASTKRCVTVHDIGWVPLERAAQTARGAKRLFRRRQAAVTKAFEVEQYNRLDALWVMSELDESLLQHAGVTSRISVVPNGVDVDGIDCGSPTANAARALFVGSAKHEPNVDALSWYLREVHSLVREHLPEYVLDVVGMQQTDVCLPPIAGVLWHGRVEQLEPFYRNASAVIAPLRVGGGTRIKILEAMAYGVPVVSTSVGIEGILAEPGRHFLLADTPRSFADAAAAVLQGRHAGVAVEARELVCTRYGWGGVVDTQIREYRALLDAPGRQDD